MNTIQKIYGAMCKCPSATSANQQAKNSVHLKAINMITAQQISTPQGQPIITAIQKLIAACGS